MSANGAAIEPVWHLKSADPPAAQSLAQLLVCPPAIARILVARGIDTIAAAQAFLHPTLAALLDDPATDPA
jgi:hypothetical protein